MRRPPALLISCAFGGAGALLLVVGAMLASTPFFVAAVACGSLSLASALYWRSELISEWRGERGGRRRP